ncbi:hypothetical protein AURDEDRAFT_161020 [Auricularia subglabra TFB-10046 SS5]|nr:hypothetical protein AURDEDRAFT_161020 [Auricularia subglabra TFB-10046 SS5]
MLDGHPSWQVFLVEAENSGRSTFNPERRARKRQTPVCASPTPTPTPTCDTCVLRCARRSTSVHCRLLQRRPRLPTAPRASINALIEGQQHTRVGSRSQ